MRNTPFFYRKSVTVVTFLLSLQLLINCGSEQQSFDLDLIKSKKQEDTRVIKIETRKVLESIYVENQDQKLDEAKKTLKTEVRFRLCPTTNTELEHCLYLARGQWISLEQTSRAASSVIASGKTGAVSSLTFGVIYTLLGAIPGAFNVARGKSFGLINGALGGFGVFMLGVATIAFSMNDKNLEENKIITITTNPDKNFTTANLDALIIEIDTLPRLLQQAEDAASAKAK